MPLPRVLCLSNVPWEYALERPHQVMRRFADGQQVFFVEEPRVSTRELHTIMRSVLPNVHVVSLHVPQDMSKAAVENAWRRCIESLVDPEERPLLWIYSLAGARAARDIDASLVVYDCVVEHARRSPVSSEDAAAELALMERADLVLTAGTALFESKRQHNVSTYPLPSSVDAAHFGRRDRACVSERSRGGGIPGPRVGFLGLVDHRVDLDLLDRLAEARPGIHFILLGGLLGVTPCQLPDRPNVHALGAKDYDELPDHVASWDAAIVPYHGDPATRRSEPCGLLAAIAAGKPVVSTPLDELGPYVERGLVTVASADDFAVALDRVLRETRDPSRTATRHRERDALLSRTSWDRTCKAMFRLVDEAVMARRWHDGAARADSSSARGPRRAMVERAHEA